VGLKKNNNNNSRFSIILSECVQFPLLYQAYYLHNDVYFSSNNLAPYTVLPTRFVYSPASYHLDVIFFANKSYRSHYRYVFSIHLERGIGLHFTQPLIIIIFKPSEKISESG